MQFGYRSFGGRSEYRRGSAVLFHQHSFDQQPSDSFLYSRSISWSDLVQETDGMFILLSSTVVGTTGSGELVRNRGKVERPFLFGSIPAHSSVGQSWL